MNGVEDVAVWGIHSQDEELFLKSKVIAIGWKEMGDLRKLEPSREAYKEHFAKVFPEAKKGSIPTSAGMLFRFVHELKIGDYVIYPSKQDRRVNIGVVEGDYFFQPEAEHYVHQRKVKWLKHIPRTSFTPGALYEIGAYMTFFSVRNFADEFLESLKKVPGKPGIDDSSSVTADNIIEMTTDFIIKELASRLKGYDFEDFVADLLEAMGYRTSVSKQGGDRGIDITAYKDELPPRIIVQVKSGDANIGESTIQSLKGAMREGDYGLFVTLADYTDNAKKYLEGSPIIRGINGVELVELILQYYEKLSDRYKKLIPLKKVYIPLGSETSE
ncbi:MAG TPA: restriction endonuclease [Bacillota bacterium]|jgi:restriction system protein|nr:restriction endonuclease [Fastidiosipila sp.]HPX93254.1 restriction endonuclease [Bacillota bacterium]HQB80913.1 restriction endonuclease [Bacillota bacterium]